MMKKKNSTAGVSIGDKANVAAKLIQSLETIDIVKPRQEHHCCQGADPLDGLKYPYIVPIVD